MNQSQLATRSDTTLTQGVEKLVHQTVMRFLDRPVQLIKGSEKPTKENIKYAKVGRDVIKISVQFRNHDLTYNPARHEFAGALPQPVISIEPASEGDLLEMERWLSQNGSGADVVAIRELIAIVRDESSKPLEIKILNAAEFTKDKAMKVSRDDTGRLTGAVIVPIS
jgi:hypothetical protein